MCDLVLQLCLHKKLEERRWKSHPSVNLGGTEIEFALFVGEKSKMHVAFVLVSADPQNK